MKTKRNGLVLPVVLRALVGQSYGEVQERGIRGRASREDTDALREEGIEVMAIPLPAALKGPVQ